MINAFADDSLPSRPTVDMSQGFRRSLCYLLFFDAIATEGARFEGKSGSGFLKNKVRSKKKGKKPHEMLESPELPKFRCAPCWPKGVLQSVWGTGTQALF